MIRLEDVMGVVDVTQTAARVPVTIFHLQERVTLANFAELEAAAREAYQNGMRNAVVDLGQTTALTSIGVRAIIVLHKILASEPGRHLKLAGPSPEIRDVLDISGVHQYVEIYNSMEDALASF